MSNGCFPTYIFINIYPHRTCNINQTKSFRKKDLRNLTDPRLLFDRPIDFLYTLWRQVDIKLVKILRVLRVAVTLRYQNVNDVSIWTPDFREWIPAVVTLKHQQRNM
jgi:hypothetical protein